MGKYSLDNYEKYETNIVRPKKLEKAFDSERNGLFTYVEANWDELEVNRGDYRLDVLEQTLKTTHQPILVIHLKKTNWVSSHDSAYAAAFIRKLGSNFDGCKYLQGVLVSRVANSTEELSAFSKAFTTTPLFVDLQDEMKVSYFMKHNKQNMGLLIKSSDEKYIETCEQLAKLKLNELWKTNPIILETTDDQLESVLQKEARRWHVSYANKPYTLGYHFELRRITFPKKASTDGCLPLRFWFVNIGTAKVYKPLQLKVKLEHEATSYELILKADTQNWLIGDIVHNELVNLPQLKQGKYTISTGLFFEDGSPINLNIENNESKGYYILGEIELEQWEKDPYATIWDSYYPEGYYPLEDPALPSEE